MRLSADFSAGFFKGFFPETNGDKNNLVAVTGTFGGREEKIKEVHYKRALFSVQRI